MKLTFKTLSDFTSSTAVFLVLDGQLPEALVALDTHEQIRKALATNKAVSDECCKVGHVTAHFCPIGYKQEIVVVLCISSDHKGQITPHTLCAAGGSLITKLNAIKCTNIDLCIQLAKTSNANFSCYPEYVATHLIEGMKLRNYAFNKYYTVKLHEHKLSLKEVNVLSTEPQKLQFALDKYEKVIDNTLFTRDLVSEPANVLYPDFFAKICLELSALGIEVKVLDATQMEKLGMQALLGVARGSSKEARLVVLEWHGDKGSGEFTPLIFVGKGVTFDTGGINLKSTASHIADMKCDMAGAAVVAGLIRALAMRSAKINAVGVLGLVENMVSGTAQRPSDVVVSMSGQTIEVDNTDAEGRLVLADALCYVQQKYKPRFIIDIATLTGAISVALGDLYAGLFSNNDELAKQLLHASQETGELLWRMPMNDYYDKQINSDIADVKNTGQANRGGGSITAAQFLQRFIKHGNNWAHLDIAGVAWTKFGNNICPKGATGFGIRLLNCFVYDYYEKKEGAQISQKWYDHFI